MTPLHPRDGMNWNGGWGRPIDVVYRASSILWLIYSIGLGLSALDVVLLDYAAIGRPIVVAASALSALAMIVRLVLPGKPRWTQWAMPLMGAAGFAAFGLAQFGITEVGGFTLSRFGYSLLLLTPALLAYMHWIAEKLVVPR